MLKAYMTWAGDWTEDAGCLLVYAHNRNEARSFSFHYGFWDCDYIYFHAIRKPDFDQYAQGDSPYAIETNEDLPEGVMFYLDDDEWPEG